MRIAICDDEEIYRVELKTILDKLLINVDYNIDTFDDGTKLMESFNKAPYDLVFLDIEMPAVDGITLAKSIRNKSENVFIVFLTGHIEYALEGYLAVIVSKSRDPCILLCYARFGIDQDNADICPVYCCKGSYHRITLDDVFDLALLAHSGSIYDGE